MRNKIANTILAPVYFGVSAPVAVYGKIYDRKIIKSVVDKVKEDRRNGVELTKISRIDFSAQHSHRDLCHYFKENSVLVDSLRKKGYTVSIDNINLTIGG